MGIGMRTRFLEVVTIIALLFTGPLAAAQNFYVSVPVNVPLGNKVFELSINDCYTALQQFCRPTENITQFPENQYIDIAIGKQNVAWYMTGSGNLYKGQVNDSTNCRYIGNIVGATGSANSLVVDSAGVVYAAGWINGSAQLLKYDSASGFSNLGSLPIGMISNGDLFFYKHRLFLTSGDMKQPKSLVEVSLPDPSKSCSYMSLNLGGAEPYGAFSLTDGQQSRAFIVAVDQQLESSLIEIDIPGKRLLPPLCKFPFAITGAAAYYSLTAAHTTCSTTTTGISEPRTSTHYSIVSPVRDMLEIRDNAEGETISSLKLYDISGRMVKELATDRFPLKWDVSDLASGHYILLLSTKSGNHFAERVVKQ